MSALLRKQDRFVKGPKSRSSGKNSGGCVMLPPKTPRLFFLPGGRKRDQGGKMRLVRFLFFLLLGFWFWKL